MKKLFLIFLLIPFNVFANSYSNLFSNNKFNITSLMNSVEQDDQKATEIFLKSGSDPNEKNIADVTALHIAAKNNSINSMKLLIEYGANVNSKDHEGWTPLMRACINSNYKSVDILLENGANLCLRNIFNETSIKHSVMSNCLECLILIQKAFKSSKCNQSYIKSEVDEALIMAYKKQNSDIENILKNFFGNVDFSDSIDKKKDSSGTVKKDIDIINERFYIFNGRVEYKNGNK